MAKRRALLLFDVIHGMTGSKVVHTNKKAAPSCSAVSPLIAIKPVESQRGWDALLRRLSRLRRHNAVDAGGFAFVILWEFG